MSAYSFKDITSEDLTFTNPERLGNCYICNLYNDDDLVYVQTPILEISNINLSEDDNYIEVSSDTSIDLPIYESAINQTIDSPSDWSDELSQIIALKAPHLSLYQLTIEENTNFYKLFKRDLLKGIPTDKTTSEMFDVTMKLCENGGYKQYETSNFAKRGFKCRHNLSYWKYHDYVGIGPGAHGRIKISGKSYATEEERNPDIWLKKTFWPNTSQS